MTESGATASSCIRGQKASHRKFNRLKFDKSGKQVKDWGVFLADDIELTNGLVFGGDVVLKVRTANFDKAKMTHDPNVNMFTYNRSFVHKDDIPVSEIEEAVADPYHFKSPF